MLVKSINKARKEDVTIVNSGNPFAKDFVVIHGDKAYTVETDGKVVLSCNCPHHVFRGAICKHMIKVSFEKNMDIIEKN